MKGHPAGCSFFFHPISGSCYHLVMEIRNLLGISTEDIAGLMNRAFADYPIPIHVTDKYLETRFRRAGVDPKLSYGLFEDGRLYGMLVSSFDNGTCNFLVAGIDPAKRGHDMLRRMFHRAFEEIPGEYSFQVEVLKQNDRAIHIYSSLGFEIKRSYVLLRGTTHGNGTCSASPLAREEAEDLEPRFKPSFENTLSALLRDGGFNLMRSKHGYLIMSPSGAVAQIGGDPEDILSSIPAMDIAFGNLDEKDTELISYLEENGFEEYASQFEMHR